jgi:hypothetical protein
MCTLFKDKQTAQLRHGQGEIGKEQRRLEDCYFSSCFQDGYLRGCKMQREGANVILLAIKGGF